MSAATYLVYADDLIEKNIPLEVIERTCKAIGHRKRKDGETSFPDFATLMEEIQVQQGHLRSAGMKLPEDIQRRIDEDAESTRKLAAGEITAEPLSGLLAEIANPKNDRKTKALSLPQKSPPRPAILTPAPEQQPCGHCGNVNSPTDSLSLFRLAAYYKRKAEDAEEREKKAAS